MMAAYTSFTCNITHHEYDRAAIEVTHSGIADQPIVDIEVFNMKDGHSTQNDSVKLTLNELKEIVEIAERFQAGRATIEGIEP